MKLDELERLAETLGGITVLGALEGSPCQRAGLRYGDILLSVNGQKTPDLVSYAAALKLNPTSLALRVFRAGQELELTVETTQALPVAQRPPDLLAQVAKMLPARPRHHRPGQTAELLS